MTEQCFTIKRWSAWMPGISTADDWRAWSSGQKLPTEGASPSLGAIPPLLRRRLSPLGKMAVSVAWSLVPPEQAIPSVFCSRHGELTRTVEMLQSLAAREPLSPTHFSLSVHNAIGGVYSIARRDTSAITAVAAGDEGLAHGLLETALILGDSGHSEALCLIYDAPMPAIYQPVAAGVGPQHPFALAMVVGLETAEAGEQPLRMRLNATGSAVSGEPHPLQFIRFLLDAQADTLTLAGNRHSWQWNKAPCRGR